MIVIDFFVFDLLDFVEMFDFEELYQCKLEYFKSIYLDWMVVFEFDLVVKVLELVVYDEVGYWV